MGGIHRPFLRARSRRRPPMRSSSPAPRLVSTSGMRRAPISMQARSIWRKSSTMTSAGTADEVEGGDDQPGDGVAADELAGAIHGAVKLRLAHQMLPSPPRFVLVDQAGVQLGVDGHLLARHGVQSETGRHFRDAAGAF